jgi:hypothetical protein
MSKPGKSETKPMAMAKPSLGGNAGCRTESGFPFCAPETAKNPGLRGDRETRPGYACVTIIVQIGDQLSKQFDRNA